jgi:hypothetical protein
MGTDEPQSKSAIGLAAETTVAFLTALGKMLRAKDKVDAGLAEILSEHLLTDTPANDAVTQAKAAILRLAAARAVRTVEADRG